MRTDTKKLFRKKRSAVWKLRLAFAIAALAGASWPFIKICREIVSSAGSHEAAPVEAD